MLALIFMPLEPLRAFSVTPDFLRLFDESLLALLFLVLDNREFGLFSKDSELADYEFLLEFKLSLALSE